MENDSFIVAVDQGTSSSRAFAVAADGSIRAQRTIPLAPHRPGEGLSEYEAQTLLNSQVEAINALLDDVGPRRVKALAVTSQRSTVVLWDKQTGRAVAPVLSWEDGRAAAEADRADISQADVHAITGLYKTPYFSAPKIAWCLARLPQAAEALQAGRLCAAPVASHLIWHLTKGKTFATDPTLAQRMLLLDIRTQSWSPALCRAFGVPETCLPAILPSRADYGTYEYRGVKIPITVCTGDQQASVAFMQLAKGQVCINYGTGAFLLYNAGTEKPVLLPGMLTSLSASDADGKSAFLLEGPVNAAGSAVQWLRAQGIAFDPAETDELCRQAKQPVWFLPALGGLGAPYWDFTFSPVAAGLSPRTRRPDWVAGVLQGVAFLLADIVAYLQQNGCAVSAPVKVSGGLARSSWLVQKQADLLQVPVHLLHDVQSTVLGAARLAAGADSAAWPLPQTDAFAPLLSPAQARQLYDRWRKFVAWCKQFPAS